MRHRAFTLVEMLIAMALTLIMVIAIAEFYARLGDTVRDGRALIEVGGQVRAAVQRLKTDLDSITVPVQPWAEDGMGYFEYTEGRGNDFDWTGDGRYLATDVTLLNQSITTLWGDTDDILAFTIRTNGEPFVGRRYVNGQITTASSQHAEVIWFTGFKDTDGDGTWQPTEPKYLCRRLLLIRPDFGQLQMPAGETDPFQFNDISARLESNQWHANRLDHLTRRENRFAHQPGAFPNHLLIHPNDAASVTAWTLQGDQRGEDVVLSNLLAFDVRAYDPLAPIYSGGNVAVEPGDVGWQNATGNELVGRGAYVDLFYNRTNISGIASHFSGGMQAKSQLDNGPARVVYDTWALDYERDGIDQDGDGTQQVVPNPNYPAPPPTPSPPFPPPPYVPVPEFITLLTNFDEGTDGVDTNMDGVVDDVGERETATPYLARMRGIEVTIRVYEQGTRQMRQATVGADFLAE